MHKPKIMSLLKVEFQSLFIISIATLLSIPMYIGAFSRSAPFDNMTLHDSKIFLYILASSVLLMPWPFILIRYLRMFKAFRNGKRVIGRVLKSIPMYAPYSRFKYIFELDGHTYKHTVDLVLTSKVRKIMKENADVELCVDKNRSFICSLYS